jgi:uncharacterized Tic20 family protein
MSTNEPTHIPSHEERVLAALAHAGVILNVFNLAGLFGVALLWAGQRNSSPYVRRHAGQALAFQLFSLLIGLVLVLAWGGCLGFALLPLALRPDLYADSWPALFWVMLTVGLVPLVYGLIVIGYGLVGGWCAYRNLPFRYAFLDRAIQISAPPPVAPPPSTSPTPPTSPGEEPPPTAPASGAAS